MKPYYKVGDSFLRFFNLLVLTVLAIVLGARVPIILTLAVQTRSGLGSRVARRSISLKSKQHYLTRPELHRPGA
jgi:hypothetical protein